MSCPIVMHAAFVHDELKQRELERPRFEAGQQHGELHAQMSGDEEGPSR